MKHSRSKTLEFKSTKDPMEVLGSFLSYNQSKNVEENFMNRIRKTKTKLNLWLSRDLTLYGKSLLAKTLGVYAYCPDFSNKKMSKQSSSISCGKTQKTK